MNWLDMSIDVGGGDNSILHWLREHDSRYNETCMCNVHVDWRKRVQRGYVPAWLKT